MSFMVSVSASLYSTMSFRSGTCETATVGYVVILRRCALSSLMCLLSLGAIISSTPLLWFDAGSWDAGVRRRRGSYRPACRRLERWGLWCWLHQLWVRGRRVRAGLGIPGVAGPQLGAGGGGCEPLPVR
jgi:hypothetical protein